MSKGYFDKAVDPKQYDKEEMIWEEYGHKDDPMRVFYKDVLRNEIVSLKNKKILDVGSGSGAFFEFYRELGASEIKGIEPSELNFRASQELFSNVQVINLGLMEADLKEEFDSIFAVMVFEHIGDIVGAYKKIRSLLRDGGLFYLIFQDMDYLKDPRYSSPVDFEEMGGGTTVVKVQSKKFGTIYDLLRTPESYIESARQAKLVIEKHVPLFPSEKLCREIPKYLTLKHMPFRHLLILRK
jgi:2-polyprenyl-3-methyl-5-hydroxy-6-metoxy-1,4-benzoquinol methylase